MQSDLQEKSSLAIISDPSDAKIYALCERAANGETINAMRQGGAATAVAFLRLQLEQCAAAYCGAPNTASETLDECVRYLIASHGHLNPYEIKEAFRLAASRQTGADLTAWHGQFTVQILGGVIAGYLDYRTALAREARSRQSKEDAEREYALKSEQIKASFPSVEEQVAALKVENRKYQRWQDVPFWLARIAVKRDLLALTVEEKTEAWKTAKAYTVNRIPAMLLEADKAEREKWQDAESIIKKEPDVFPAVLQEEAERVYAQMLMFSKIAEYEDTNLHRG